MEARPNAPRFRERLSRQGRRPADDGFFGSYRSRFLTGLFLSLGLAVAAVHLPLHLPPEAVHWYAADETEVIPLEPQHKTTDAPGDDVYSPMVAELLFDNRILPAAARSSGAEEEPEEEVVEERTETRRLERIGHRDVLQFAEEMPDIVGGMRSLYLRIHYPQAARDQGIEGLVVLGFVVDEEGWVHDLRVIESVHPLLDSAAVRAVRQTRFTPGRQGDVNVKVAMRLPVRFQLITLGEPVADQGKNEDI